MGNCPPGEMSYDILSRPLPGYQHCGTIRVSYYISPGVQVGVSRVLVGWVGGLGSVSYTHLTLPTSVAV